MDQDVLYFFDGKPEALPLYEAFEQKVFSKVDGVKVKVQKTQIMEGEELFQGLKIWEEAFREGRAISVCLLSGNSIYWKHN